MINIQFKIFNSFLNLLSFVIVFFIIKVSAVSFLGLHDRGVYILVVSILCIISLISFYIINYTRYAEIGLYMTIVKSLIILLITVMIGISVLVSEGTEIVGMYNMGIQKVVWDSNRLEDLLNVFSNRQRINIPVEVREMILGKSKCPEDIKKYMLEYKLAQQDTYYNKYLKDVLNLIGIRQQPTLTEWVTLIGVFYTGGKFVYSLYKFFYGTDTNNSELNTVGEVLNDNTTMANIGNSNMGQSVENLNISENIVEPTHDKLAVLGGILVRGLTDIMMSVIVDDSTENRLLCYESLRRLCITLELLFPDANDKRESNEREEGEQ